MKPNIEIKSQGLKCDNPKCDWKNDTILAENYDQWINKPCPDCGENILTEGDYKNSELLRSATAYVNSLSPEQLEELYSKLTPDQLEEIKNSPFLKNAEGIEGIDSDGTLHVKIDTHKEIKVTKITKLND